MNSKFSLTNLKNLAQNFSFVVLILDLLHVADKEIETTQDLEHIYFEGMHIIKQINTDLHQIELMLGS